LLQAVNNSIFFKIIRISPLNHNI